MDNDNKWGLLIIAGLLIGLYWLAKKSSPAPMGASYDIQPEPAPLRLRPSSQPIAQSNEEHRYRNSEVWAIEWTSDGLPSKVTIKRDAVQT
jgi:hypothetical protein